MPSEHIKVGAVVCDSATFLEHLSCDENKNFYIVKCLDSERQAQENANFYPPNRRLVLYNLLVFSTPRQIFFYCHNRANFIPPLELYFDMSGNFLGQVALSFAGVADTTRAFFAFNREPVFPIFAQFGNPNYQQADLDWVESFPTNKLIEKYNSGPASPSTLADTRSLIASSLGGFWREKNSFSVGSISTFMHKIGMFSAKNIARIMTMPRAKFMLSLFSPIRSIHIAKKTFLSLSRGAEDTPRVDTPHIIAKIGKLRRRVLTVSSKTQVKAIAGAIAHTIRKGQCPIILSGGAEGINLSLKAIAISYEYLSENQLSIYCYLEKSNDFGGMRFVVLRDAENRFGVTPGLKTGMLRVSKHSKIFRTAALVSHLLGRSGSLTIGSMGSGSVLQSMKSLLIAGKLLCQHSLFLAFQPRFISLQIGDFGKEKRSVLKIEINIDILLK